MILTMHCTTRVLRLSPLMTSSVLSLVADSLRSALSSSARSGCLLCLSKLSRDLDGLIPSSWSSLDEAAIVRKEDEPSARSRPRFDNSPLLECENHGPEPEEVETIQHDVNEDVEVADRSDVGCFGLRAEEQEEELV